MNEETSIIVDVEYLKSVINSISSDGEYPYVKLEITSDGYDSELRLIATDQDGNSVEYGKLASIVEE